MSLQFEGKEYVTIADVKKRFPIAEKTLKQLIRDGKVPEPEMIKHGTRSFRHYSAEWQKELAKVVAPRGANGG